MITIKIKIGFKNKHSKIKKESGIQKAVIFAAFADSAVWLLDTALMLKFFYVIPLSPAGVFLLAGIFFLYPAYLVFRTWIFIKKYGKERYHKELGHTGMLLAAVSAVHMFLLIVTAL